MALLRASTKETKKEVLNGDSRLQKAKPNTGGTTFARKEVWLQAQYKIEVYRRGPPETVVN